MLSLSKQPPTLRYRTEHRGHIGSYHHQPTVTLTLILAVSMLAPMAVRAPKVTKSRIDALLVARGLVASRQQAQAALLAGAVRVGGEPFTKPSGLVSESATIEVLHRPAYVGRGGDKLAHALQTFD